MATPAQTQVTLDASQFIASVDLIGKSIVDMNKNLATAGAAFQGFAASSQKMETSLQKMELNVEATVNGLNALFNATKQATSVQQAMSASLLQVAGSSDRSARALEQLTQASTRTSQAGVRDAKAFTFAWDGIFRLLTVTVIRRVFLDIAGAIGHSIQTAADYQEQVGRIVAIHQNLGVSADELAGRFNNLALAYGRSLKDTADIGRIAAGAGGAQSVEQIDAITNSAMRLAEVSGSTGAQAATAITSITRAFQMTAEESQHVSNQLVHLTQSGIGVEAISGSIGRVSAQAQRLGVSFSEMGLLMEELKATGISDAEVMTQLGAVFNSLERPTQRMRELMEGNGIFSPQQLIQAQRLHGALQLIKQDVSEGNIQANQAVQGRRAGGGLAVADSFAARSQNNPLNNVEGLNNTANAALRVVDATGRWNDELEKIRTIFAGEIGPQIIKIILDISDRAGGLSNVITDTGRYIAALLEPIALVVGGAVVLGQQVERLAEFFGILNSATRVNRESMAAFSEAAREAMERTNTWAAAQRQITRQGLQEGTQAIANTFVPVNAALTRQSEVQRERVHTLGEEIEASSKSIFGAFASQIEVLESVTRQAESRILESLKRVQEFSDKTTKDAFEHRLKSAGDVFQATPFTNATQQDNAAKLLTAQNRGADQQLALIRDRARRLNDEIAELQARGDANSIESARRRFVQLRQLNDQEYDIRQGSARRNAEFTARATGSDQVFNPFNRERESGARRLNAAEEAFEAANRRRLASQQLALEGINRRLREQIQLVQEGQRNVARLPNQLLTPEGRPRENFQGTAGGALAGRTINDTIDTQIARIRQLPATIEAGIVEALRTGSINPDQAEQARRRAPTTQEVEGLTAQLENQRIATQALFQTAEARRVSEANQARQISLLTEIARNTDNSTRQATEARQQQVEQLRVIQERLNAAAAEVPTAQGTFLNLDGQQQERVRSNQIRNELLSAIQEASGSTRVAASTGRPEDIAAAQTATARVVRLFEDLMRSRGELGANQTLDGSNALRAAIERLTEVTATRTQAETTIAASNARAEADRQGRAGSSLVGAGQQGIGVAVNGVVNALDQAPEALRTLADRIRQGLSGISGIVPPGLVPPPAGPPNLGGPIIQNGPAPVIINVPPPLVIPPPPVIVNGNIIDPEGFAQGGLIGNAFSNFGPDNVMIRARRGEFVVNPESTQKFYATLVRMNRGDSPRGGGYAHGGTVTNSIGNMTFNVNGSDSPEQTARAVMKIIRREQRRGNA